MTRAEQIVDDVGGERAGDGGLLVTLGAVVEQHPGGRRRSCGMGDVVGEHLVDVRTAGVAQRVDASGDHLVGGGDQLGRGSEVGTGAHERRIYPRVTLG